MDGVFVIWLGNIYLNRGLAKQVQKLFSIIQNEVPNHEKQNLILVGDFNVDLSKQSPKLTLLKNLCKQFQLDLHETSEPTRGHAKLDFMICGSGISVNSHATYPSSSDHKLILWGISFKNNCSPPKTKILNRLLAEEITNKCVMDKDIKSAMDLLKKFLEMRKARQKEAYIKIKPRKKVNEEYMKVLMSIKDENSIAETLENYWKTCWDDNERERFSPMSKNAFKTLETKFRCYLKDLIS